MQIRESENNDILILEVEGCLDSSTSESFRQQLIKKIEAGHQRIIIDFSTLEYISSAGLRVLLLAAKRLNNEGNGFVLHGLAAHIREVFELSGFLKILTVVKHRKEALAVLSVD